VTEFVSQQSRIVVSYRLILPSLSAATMSMAVRLRLNEGLLVILSLAYQQ